MSAKDRFSLDFPAGAKDQFEALRVKSGAATVTEMFRKAVSFYELFLDAQQDGGKIIIEKNGERERIRIL